MKHADIIKQMTLEEKCYLFSGKDFWQTRSVERLGVPNMTLSDGTHGIRKQAGEGDQLGLNPSLPATCYPTAAAVANSWDVELGEEIGAHLGAEAASQGVCVVLGPGLNIKRSPFCGRNFEYFSEDPYLAGKLAASYIRGIQKNGVSACPKHFAANSQELRRMASDSVVDERTLREMKTREYTSQYVSPPVILSLSMQEAQLLNEHLDRFQRIGFEIEPFGGKEYAVRAVPANLFGIAKKELLMEMLDSLSECVSLSMTSELIDEKVASLSCKAAVKGNSRLSAREVDALIGELLLLSNPYHCPHGRPTIIAMSRRDLEKKFKRVI